jgi:hypothetical protein
VLAMLNLAVLFPERPILIKEFHYLLFHFQVFSALFYNRTSSSQLGVRHFILRQLTRTLNDRV